MRLSIVIPALNEAGQLPDAIAAVRARAECGPAEIIVVDCGSTDATPRIAQRLGARCVADPDLTTRARACNAGAAVSSHGVLLFLHADCRVPVAFDRLIFNALADEHAVGGAFEFKLDGPEWRLRLVEGINRLRYRLRGRFFGDQGIFLRRDVFRRIGGFPNVAILEDARLCAEARHAGRMRLIRAPMYTSPRRFYAGGILRTLIADGVILLRDLAGLDLSTRAAAYRLNNLSRARRRAGPTGHPIRNTPAGRPW